MRVSMAAIIHRAGRKFNVDAADGVSGRDKMRILITGAGVAGLSTAVALRRAGATDLTILERASQVAAQSGTGIAIPPNGSRALADVGLAVERLIARGSHLREYRLLDPAGHELSRADLTRLWLSRALPHRGHSKGLGFRARGRPAGRLSAEIPPCPPREPLLPDRSHRGPWGPRSRRPLRVHGALRATRTPGEPSSWPRPLAGHDPSHVNRRLCRPHLEGTVLDLSRAIRVGFEKELRFPTIDSPEALPWTTGCSATAR
jgi:FAD dependent oxidoreductase